MEKEQVWDFLIKSNKVKMTKLPGFLFNLKTGSVNGTGPAYANSPQIISTRSVKDYVEMYKIVEEHDIIVVVNDINKTFREHFSESIGGENLSVKFSNKTVSYFAINKNEMANLLIENIRRTKLLKKCMKDKNKSKISTGQINKSVGIGGGYSLTVNEPRNNYQ